MRFGEDTYLDKQELHSRCILADRLEQTQDDAEARSSLELAVHPQARVPPGNDEPYEGPKRECISASQ